MQVVETAATLVGAMPVLARTSRTQALASFQLVTQSKSMGFSSNYDNAITGVILIVIVVADALIQARSAEKNRHARLAARVSDDVTADVATAKGGE